MKGKELPTPRELIKALGMSYISIRYGHSRLIKDYADKPVAAFGFGYNGFVCIIRSERSVLRAYQYGKKSEWEASFGEIGLTQALDEIKNNKYLVDKGISQSALETGNVRIYDTKPIATVQMVDGWTTDYGIFRNKKGELKIGRKYKWRKIWQRGTFQAFFRAYERATMDTVEFKKQFPDSYGQPSIDKKLPDEILNEIKMFVTAQNI